jgi:hypothetical protein
MTTHNTLFRCGVKAGFWPCSPTVAPFYQPELLVLSEDAEAGVHTPLRHPKGGS